MRKILLETFMIAVAAVALSFSYEAGLHAEDDTCYWYEPMQACIATTCGFPIDPSHVCIPHSSGEQHCDCVPVG